MSPIEPDPSQGPSNNQIRNRPATIAHGHARSAEGVTQVALFAALIAVFGLVPRIDLPFLAGVPITIQTLGVMLAGLFLVPRRAALSVGLFLLIVLLGAPLLSGGRGGLGVLFGPSAGFLLGWILGAWLTSVCARRLILSGSGAERPLSRWQFFSYAFICCLVGGVLSIYLVGIPWLAWRADMGISAAGLIGLSFLPGDLVKAAIASWIALQLRGELFKRIQLAPDK